MKKRVLSLVIITVVSFVMSGCSAMQETFSSQMEVPTLENQANRVAIGMIIVRENNIMAQKMPISADALWPEMVSAEMDDSTRGLINNAVKNDPYFATKHYTKHIQRKMLGSNENLNFLGKYANLTATILDQSISPLTYRALQKITIFYGKDEKNWPNIFNYSGSFSDFLEFKNGNLQDIESPTGDIYETIGEAVISLTPTNLQKDLDVARREMLDGFDEVASYKSQIGELETELKPQIKGNKNSLKLSRKKRFELEQELALLKAKSKEAESFANERELIYYELLDRATIAIESEIDLNDKNYFKLAKNINLVAQEIYTGATEAYTSFGVALGNLASNNIVENFPTELKSLAIGKAFVPMRLQSKYNKRVLRVAKNSIYLFPNIFMGTYYASKQLALARKYENLTELILIAYETKQEQEEEFKHAKGE
ncbi:MAG: hypothetical protein U9Q29_09565 [Campylobacterota bacterium]|nr:hypothetical protein [Campylobacterota bacterium]